jgi:hypothetical protein
MGEEVVDLQIKMDQLYQLMKVREVRAEQQALVILRLGQVVQEPLDIMTITQVEIIMAEAAGAEPVVAQLVLQRLV